jgi:hypothetical protein
MTSLISPAFRLPLLSFGEGFAIFSPQRSQPPHVHGSAMTSSRDLTQSSVYTGASSPSLLSSLLSALCAVGHVHASVDAASSIIISASHVRIFQRGLSLQRLATYNAAASALAKATAALLTSTGRGISLLSLAARERGSERLPRKYVSRGANPASDRAYYREARGSLKADQPGPSPRRDTWPTPAPSERGEPRPRRLSPSSAPPQPPSASPGRA